MLEIRAAADRARNRMSRWIPPQSSRACKRFIESLLHTYDTHGGILVYTIPPWVSNVKEKVPDA